jgi:hypothetical protein
MDYLLQIEEQSKVCIALQDGKEVAFSAYDILISTVHDSTSLSLTAANLPKDLKALLTPGPLVSGPPAATSKPGNINKPSQLITSAHILLLAFTIVYRGTVL